MKLKTIEPENGNSSLVTRRSSLRGARRSRAFALYEVMIGVAIFALGILALGHAVENCLNASVLTAEEDRVRQLLSNRMAEVQATPGMPETAKESKVQTGYGEVRLVQKVTPAPMQEDNADVSGIQHVTLTAKWQRGGVDQSKSIEFYVYRAG